MASLTLPQLNYKQYLKERRIPQDKMIYDVMVCSILLKQSHIIPHTRYTASAIFPQALFLHIGTAETINSPDIRASNTKIRWVKVCPIIAIANLRRDTRIIMNIEWLIRLIISTPRRGTIIDSSLKSALSDSITVVESCKIWRVWKTLTK